MTKRLHIVLSFIFAVVIAVSALVFPTSIPLASAAETVVSAYDEQNIMQDLEGSTIGGKSFDVKDYPRNTFGHPQIIHFVEFCYSYDAEKQSDFGLYVYVYNPQQVAIDTDTERNKIEISYGSKTGKEYSKYVLEFLNYSTETGLEGRFYKFKLRLSDAAKYSILNNVNEDERVYEVVGIELSIYGKVEDYTCAQMYTYTGFAKGYGSELAEGDTVSAQVDGLERLLNLDVHTTYYRPEGTNGKNDYTQDSLHSAYFAVPKDVIAEFDAMSAVHATWLDAVLSPVLVTGNKEVCDAIERYLGKDIGETVEGLDYAYVGNATRTVVQWAGTSNIYGWVGPFGYNLPSSWADIGGLGSSNRIERTVSPLYWLFYSGSAENSADEYVLSSETLQQGLIDNTERYGGDLVNDRYSRVLFDSISSEFTDVEISADYEFDLRSEVLGSSWWDKLWGITYDQSDVFDGVKAIEAVSDDDFVYAGDGVDIPATCNDLFISEADYSEFEQFYNVNKDDCVIYLFRYQVSDYVSSEATLFERDGWLSSAFNKSGDSNAYFMQQTVNLDFDVIDVTFTKGNVSTVIPVVSSPVDNIPDGTPPVYTEDDKLDMDWLKWLFAALALIIVLIILAPLLPYVFKFLLWLLMLPAKLVVWIIGLFKRKNE